MKEYYFNLYIFLGKWWGGIFPPPCEGMWPY
jgi:hypothetical protein